VLYPATRHDTQEKVGTKIKRAHNPKDASNPEHGAARTTKGGRTTGEHDPDRCFTKKPDAPHKNKWAHNQRRAHDRGARPKGCFTQKPDTPHTRKWALRRKGRTTRRVRQIRNTGRRSQPKACARKGCTTLVTQKPDTREL